MACENCNCPRCRQARADDRAEQGRRWDAVPPCPDCGGTGKVEDVCGHHVAMIPCGPCGGTGKRGMGRGR